MGTKITTVLVDCDGSLASSQILYFRSGDVARSFSTYDGEGVALLKEHGIRVAIITQSDVQEIKDRAEWLGISCYSGMKNKAEAIRLFALVYNTPLDEICFMGNDLNDLGALELCGYPAAPHDADHKVWLYCVENGLVTDRSGGNGAFRELVNHLIDVDFDPKFVHPPYP